MYINIRTYTYVCICTIYTCILYVYRNMRYIHAYINNIYLYIICVCMCVVVHILEGGDQLQTKTFTSDHMQTVLPPPSPPY